MDRVVVVDSGSVYIVVTIVVASEVVVSSSVVDVVFYKLHFRWLKIFRLPYGEFVSL